MSLTWRDVSIFVKKYKGGLTKLMIVDYDLKPCSKIPENAEKDKLLL